MAVLWIIEKNASDRPTLAMGLLGEFAVRVFASCESALKIAGLRNGPKPSLVLVNLAKTQSLTHLQPLAKLGCPICVVGEDWQKVKLNGAIFIPEWADEFELSKKIRQLLVTRSSARPSLSYRDLEFDPERYELRIPLLNLKENLPKKEALILKLFMMNPGACLSRQDIKNNVWSDIIVTERTIDCHVSRLRKRMVDSEATIQSVYGGGYILS